MGVWGAGAKEVGGGGFPPLPHTATHYPDREQASEREREGAKERESERERARERERGCEGQRESEREYSPVLSWSGRWWLSRTLMFLG